VTPSSGLAAAASATANTTYRLRYTETLSAIPGVALTDSDRRFIEQGGKPLVSEGAYDHSSLSGYLIPPKRAGGDTREHRLVQGELFVGPVGGPFTKNQGRFETLGYAVLGTGALLSWVEPWQMLTRVQQPETFVPTGPDTYRLSVQENAPPNPKVSFGSVPITIEVTVSGGYIRRVTLESPNEIMMIHITIDFSDFGAPVVVPVPTPGATP